MEFLSALFAIVIIDIVLAGDNAIVIALAARSLPAEIQKRAIIWGTVGAIVARVIMTLAVVWLLKIPGLMMIGGVLLIWIAYRLIAPVKEEEGSADVTSAKNFMSAIKTIVIADTVMGVDNILGVAGAAGGSFLLVIIGLLISIPIMVWGSTMILKWVERWPIIIYLGAGILAWTAAKMINQEPIIKDYLQAHWALTWVIYCVIVGGILLSGYLREKQSHH